MHHIFADPTSDLGFQRVFGSNDHTPVLHAFLDTMLALPAGQRIVRIERIPPRSQPTIEGLTLSTITAECTDASGDLSIIELQLLAATTSDPSVLRRAAEVYLRIVTHELRQRIFGRIVGIAVATFPLWGDDDERKQTGMVTRWCMMEQNAGLVLGLPPLVVLELPKLDDHRPPQTMEEKWAYFLREAGRLTEVPEVLAEPPFLHALAAARTSGSGAPQ